MITFKHKILPDPDNSVTVFCCVIMGIAASLFIPRGAKAQQLEKIGQDDGISVSGGLSTNHVLYFNSGIGGRRDPYNYFLSGNLNFNFYGFSVPLSFSYSNQQFRYRQPFNQFGISPEYKWVQGHFGYRNMSFSSYTLNGHIFLGGGLDLSPGDNWNISMMFGRLNKAVEPGNNAEPFYRRWGTGLKAEYDYGGGNKVSFVVFGAWDDQHSLESPPDSLNITPEENMVWSLGFTKSLFDNFSLSFEFARSAHTEDSRAPLEENAYVRSIDRIFAISQRTSTNYYNAMNGELSYRVGNSSIGVGYERVDPQYRTLGSYYFNNDLENLTLNFSTTYKKINFSGNLGGQRNNLDNTKNSSMQRLVGSANVSFPITSQWNTSLSYSNFQTYNNMQPVDEQALQLSPYENLDTLNYVQISQNASASSTYNFGSDEKSSKVLTFNGSYQQTSDKRGNEKIEPNSKIYNLNLNYVHSLLKKHINFNIGANSTINDNNVSSTELYGFTFGASKPFFEKLLKTSLSVNVNNNYEKGSLTGRIFNVNASGNMSVKEHHSINLSANFLHRKKLAEGSGFYNRNFQEITVRAGYSYSF